MRKCSSLTLFAPEPFEEGKVAVLAEGEVGVGVVGVVGVPVLPPKHHDIIQQCNATPIILMQNQDHVCSVATMRFLTLNCTNKKFVQSYNTRFARLDVSKHLR